MVSIDRFIDWVRSDEITPEEVQQVLGRKWKNTDTVLYDVLARREKFGVHVDERLLDKATLFEKEGDMRHLNRVWDLRVATRSALLELWRKRIIEICEYRDLEEDDKKYLDLDTLPGPMDFAFQKITGYARVDIRTTYFRTRVIGGTPERTRFTLGDLTEASTGFKF